jgi:hypothetical protein
MKITSECDMASCMLNEMVSAVKLKRQVSENKRSPTVTVYMFVQGVTKKQSVMHSYVDGNVSSPGPSALGGSPPLPAQLPGEV